MLEKSLEIMERRYIESKMGWASSDLAKENLEA